MWDDDLKCIIKFANKKDEIVLLKWSFLMDGFLKDLYKKYQNNWKFCDFYFNDKIGNPYGRFYNSKELKSKIDKILTRRDFKTIVIHNYLIDCILFLKSEPKNPRFYTITKQNLIDDFVNEMYDLHGNDWDYFETFFNDSKQVAYGVIKNNSYREKHKYLTFSGLKNRRKNMFKKDQKERYYLEKENVYILHFGDFVKIGHTFRKIENRLYNYLFPSSSKELLLYKDKNIDFSKSFFINTNIRRFDIKFYKIKAVESIIKKKFRKMAINNSTEIFDVKYFKPIFNELSTIAKDKNIELMSLMEYTGFKDAKEMINYNSKKGIIPKVVQLYSSKQKVKIFLKNDNEKSNDINENK